MVDKLFTKFLKYTAKFIRLFISKPKLGSININKSDALRDKK